MILTQEQIARLEQLKSKQNLTLSEKAELDFIYFNLWVPTQKRYWDASTIEGTREKYNINFNLDGSVREFKKR